MKTTVLLCALATIAAAVPTNHHEPHQEHEPQLDDHTNGTIQRERKSPLHAQHAAELSHEAGAEDIHTQSTSQTGHKISPTEGRSFGFKKPIIVKKKIGYHVYRDSDEEMAHADPHENCRKEVKVKLCDEEPGSPKNMGNCFVTERLNTEISEKEIENSIKTAKEAVENLQRGFHKLEHSSERHTKIEDKELEDDIAVHQHIEAARKALEHVHHNFGNLDALNLQVTSPKADDFQSKSSDEERLAQWKEAIDNIQKNFEIARNIEDAFKADSEQINLQSTHVDESLKQKTEHSESIIDSKQRSNHASLSKEELMPDVSDVLMKHSENSDIDMFTAPTEQKELKIKLHSDSLRSEKTTEEHLDDHETETINTQKLNEHVPMSKNSETMPMPNESLKTEGILQEVTDLTQYQQSKAANGFNVGNENEKTLETNTDNMKLKTEKSAESDFENTSSFIKDDELNLVKSAHVEGFDQTIKHHKHDMSMAASDVISHQSQVDMKHKGNSVMSLTDEHTIDQPLKINSVLEVEHVKDGKMESISHNNNGRMNHEVSPPIQANTKHIQPTPIRETEFNNGHQNIDEHLMRMIDDQNMEHKLNEMHKHSEHPIANMRVTEDQKFHDFLMRWANENQQRSQELPLSLTEDLSKPTKMSEFNNGHFHDVHPSMRLNQDHNTDHHLSEHHEQYQPTHWAHENHQTLPPLAKTATDFHESMKINQHQNVQNQEADNQNLRDFFLMRMAQEKQQNEHFKTAPEFHNGHLHDILEQNKFANNLASANDMPMSQLGPRMNEHLHIMKHAMMPDLDSAMQPSMHMSMRDSIGKPTMEHGDMHWNHHHHAMARYGSGLPITGASSGAVGLFPNANTGSCGIPLMLSCSPNVVSGTLAKAQPHPGTMTPSAYRSGDDFTYYIKRDAKDTDELPTPKIQKTSIPFNHKPQLIFDKTQ